MAAAAAAGHELTARTAADVLAAGGNAVDATVAAAATSWAAEPGLISPCGGGFLMVRPAGTGKLHLLDAFTAIPGRDLPPERRLATFDRVDVPFDERTTQVFHIGAAACAVPGVVAGIAAVASYRAVWRRPLRISYHGRREIYTNPPPSSGGVLIGHMLAVLRGVAEPLPPGRARTLRAYAEAMRSAARLRDRRFERLLHH